VMEVEELIPYVRKRPPLSYNQKLLLLAKSALIKSVIIFLGFSVILAILSATIEKAQFSSFLSEVERAYERNEPMRQKAIAIEIENERKREEMARWQLLEQIRLKNGLEPRTPPYTSDFSVNTVDEGVGTVSFDTPIDEVYVMKDDGTSWTRWCVGTGSIYQNENASYEYCTSFFLRPYYALFTHSNLSTEEQNNVFTLYWNFILSSFFSNLPLLIGLFVFFVVREKHKFFVV
jgi:hypothetical protein